MSGIAQQSRCEARVVADDSGLENTGGLVDWDGWTGLLAAVLGREAAK